MNRALEQRQLELEKSLKAERSGHKTPDWVKLLECEIEALKEQCVDQPEKAEHYARAASRLRRLLERTKPADPDV